VFPSLDLDLVSSELTDTGETQGDGLMFDFEENEFITEDGKVVQASGSDAVKIWVEKLLRTEKYKFKIYQKEDSNEDEYGVAIRELVIGKKYPVGFLQSELKRLITEAILKNSLVDSVDDFTISRDSATLSAYFTVMLKDGQSFSQEVTIT
jgi:hypothetical protein